MSPFAFPLLLLFSASGAAALFSAPSPSPEDVLGRAIPYLLAQSPASALLSVHEYGPAIALAAVFDASAAFGGAAGAAWAAAGGALLDAYAANESSLAYAVLHGRACDAGYSVGDELGLMPLGFIARAAAAGVPYGNGSARDWLLAERVVDEYVLPWNRTLPDGTLSRDVGSWAPDEPDAGASFLWSDDQFMGTALLARLARAPGFPRAKAAALAEWALRQQLGFAARMQRADGLFAHGYDAATGDASCCAWARANGWVMMAHAEVVRLAAAAAPDSARLPVAVRVWRAHARALLAAQDARTGLWRQVLDAPATFLETSASAMFVQSLADGARGGWLDADADLARAVAAGWAGVAAAVAPNGSVAGICEGTGIGADVAFYEARRTDYALAAPGIGAVFRAALAVADLAAHREKNAL
jgi:hypothetical protein